MSDYNEIKSRKPIFESEKQLYDFLKTCLMPAMDPNMSISMTIDQAKQQNYIKKTDLETAKEKFEQSIIQFEDGSQEDIYFTNASNYITILEKRIKELEQ